jgi:hypothetical protein
MTDKKSLTLLSLGVFNLVGGLIHLTFEFFLLNNDSIYREFLLIENLLIGLVYIFLAGSLFWGDRQQRMFTIKANILFWLCFTMAVWGFQPEITSLNIIKELLPVPQKYALIIIGITTFFLSTLSYQEAKKMLVPNSLSKEIL